MLHVLFEIVAGLALLVVGLIGLGFVVGPVVVGGRRSRDRRAACDPVDCATLGCPESEACQVRRDTPAPYVWSPPVLSRREVHAETIPHLQTIEAANMTAVCSRCYEVVRAGDPRFVTHVICDDCNGPEHARMDAYFASQEGRTDG